MEVSLHPRKCPICKRAIIMQAGEIRIDLEIDPNFIGRGKTARTPWPWGHCPDCDLQTVVSAPSEEWMNATYKDSGLTDENLDVAAATTAAALWNQYVPSSVQSVIEIGCGKAHFLRLLKQQGVQVCGTEPNAALREASTLNFPEILDLPEISKLKTSGRKFDALTLQLSIEHLFQPRENIEAMKDMLNNRAYLFILYHDAAGVAHRLMGQSSPLFDPQHLQLFQHRSMRALCHEINANLLLDIPYANTYPITYWANLLGLKLSGILPAALIKSDVKLRAGNRIMLARFRN